MKKIMFLDPSISSFNMGDHIISKSIKEQLSAMFKNYFSVGVSTHLPLSRYLKYTGYFDYKFVCGSNLIRGKMNRIFRQWDINLYSQKYIKGSILVGVGWWQYNDNPNLYTKLLYSKVLNKNYTHSVRDEYTLNQFKKMGINNVINTGCPTMWNLDEIFCAKIPKYKSEKVVTTITDYNRDFQKDKQMIEILLKSYKEVFLWPQGVADYDYFKEIHPKKNITVLEPSLESFDEILKSNIDYVGTRLHAGIRAMQFKRRSIIIGIDNRAIEKKKTFNINCIDRNEIENLENLIKSEIETKIKLPIENIKKWKSQFINLEETSEKL